MGDFKSAFAITPKERAAMLAGKDVPSRDNGQNYLYAPEGHTLTQNSDTNKSQVASLEAQQKQGGASLSGGPPQESHPADRSGMQGTSPSQASAPKQLTPDQLLAQFHAQMGDMAAQHEAQMAAGASTGVRDSAGGKIPDWLVGEMKKNDTDM